MHHLDWLENAAARRRARAALLWSVGLTLALYVIPFGNLLAYPLLLASTLFHELGHGVAAIATGGSFEWLRIYADGSGLASNHSGSGPIADAIVAAGGLVGPACIAALGFVAGRSVRGARVLLLALAAGLAVALVLVVDNAFGIVFTLALAAAMVGVAWRTSAATAQLALVFLATQLALSVFSRGDYLFKAVAHTGAGELPSDTARIAAALGGPYWVWGLVCGLFSIAVLAGGVAWFLRVLRDAPRPNFRRT
jgi:hypothetical protein